MICVGVAAMTFWHVVVNVAMVLGLAPVVGVTLPFISYGGSSLVTFFVAMGLVANVSLRKHGYLQKFEAESRATTARSSHRALSAGCLS